MRYMGPLIETVCIELRKLLLFFLQTTPLLTRDFSVFCLCSVDFFLPKSISSRKIYRLKYAITFMNQWLLGSKKSRTTLKWLL